MISHLGIVGAWSYAWQVLTACFVFGIVIYLIDRSFGVYVYRFAYDICHKNPMPKTEVRGFLVNQSSKRGGSVAAFISTIYSMYMVYELGFSMNLIAELFVWAGMPVLLAAGFWVSGWVVHPFLQKRDKYFQKADELSEKLEGVNLDEVVRDVRSKGSSLFSKVAARIPTAIVQKAPPAPEPVAPPAPEEPKPSFQEQLKKFRGG